MLRYSPMIETLDYYLNQYTISDLKALAHLLSLDVPNHKAELVRWMSQYIRTHLEQIIKELSDLEQNILSEVVHSGRGWFDEKRLYAKYGRDVPRLYIDLTRVRNASKLHFFIYGGNIPSDLRDKLQNLLPQPPDFTIKTISDLPAFISVVTEPDKKRKLVIRETESDAWHDIQAILRLAQEGKIKVSAKTGKPTPGSTALVTGMLKGGDYLFPENESSENDSQGVLPIKAFAWPVILQGSGLAKISDSKLVLSKKGEQALNRPAHEVIEQAWRDWLKYRTFDPLSRFELIRGQRGKGKRYLTPPMDRHYEIEDALCEVPANEWILCDDFSRFVQAEHYFQVSRNLWTLYFSELQYGALGYEGFSKWNILQGRYILLFLFEYAATLGLIDIAYTHPAGARYNYRNIWGLDDASFLTRYDGLMYFKINNLGQYCLGHTTEYTRPAISEKHMLSLDDDLMIKIVVPLQPGDISYLEKIADQIDKDMWQLNGKKLLAFIEDGESIENVSRFFLQRAEGKSLPVEFGDFLQDVKLRSTIVSDEGEVQQFRITDESALQILKNKQKPSDKFRVLNDGTILVPKRAVKAFREELHELGFGIGKSG
ncbi:hypothetical protein EH223_13315 [candidate division KSB1 bacterium]|nr:hypothetical protein [candidate division KSB1 bacterium]RQW02027.1 MAG: hypothetical protein EH223_13315 [candidate division KSB1 bacterium]